MWICIMQITLQTNQSNIYHGEHDIAIFQSSKEMN